MKMFLRATAAAALFLAPGISAASTLDYVQNGSGYTVLFNPNGPGMDNLPPSFFYRSYNCRIGSKPVVITDIHVVPPPPKTYVPPPPPSDGGNTPPITIDVPPPSDGITTPPGCDDGGSTASVPLPASSEMAGAGLAAVALASWYRARRLARA